MQEALELKRIAVCMRKMIILGLSHGDRGQRRSAGARVRACAHRWLAVVAVAVALQTKAAGRSRSEDALQGSWRETRVYGQQHGWRAGD